MHGLFDFIISFKIKITEKPHSFACRPLIFKLQQEVLKSDNICVGWSSPKTELVKKFLNSKNTSLENVSIVTFR